MKNGQTFNDNLSDKPSRKWLFIILAITLFATMWTVFNSEKTSENAALMPIEKASIEKAPVTLTPNSIKHINRPIQKTNILINESNPIPWQKLEREPLKDKPYDLFKVHSWLVPTPIKKLKPLPLPPPMAPQAPFTYLGKYENSPKNVQIFLIANNQLYSVSKGEKIDQQWRLDDEDANNIHLTYLPLNLPQILSKSAKPDVSLPTLSMPETAAELTL